MHSKSRSCRRKEVDRSGAKAEFTHALSGGKIRQAGRDDNLTARCKTYIQQHIQEPLRLNGIAKAFRLSTDYLSALSRIAGVPLEAILREKIRQAADLLRYTSYRPGRVGWDHTSSCWAIAGTLAGTRAERKVAMLALFAATGSIISAISNMVAGALSDNTHSRFGKRAPWVSAVRSSSCSR